MDAHIAVSEDGTLRFADAEGTPLVSHLEARVKDQQGAAIKELLVNGCKEFTEKMEGLESLHLASTCQSELSAGNFPGRCARISHDERAEPVGSSLPPG